jgi:hypothetical protein
MLNGYVVQTILSFNMRTKLALKAKTPIWASFSFMEKYGLKSAVGEDVKRETKKIWQTS